MNGIFGKNMFRLGILLLLLGACRAAEPSDVNAMTSVRRHGSYLAEAPGEENLPQGLYITPQQIDLVVGERLQFFALGIFPYEGKKEVTPAVTWLSSDPNLFVLDDSGIGTAVGAGEVQVHADYQGLQAEASLQIGMPEWDLLTLFPKSLDIQLISGKNGWNSQIVRFTASGVLSNGAIRPVDDAVDWQWSANPEEGLTALEPGLFEIRAPGKYQVEARFQGMTVTRAFEAVAIPPALQSISLETQPLVLAIGEEQKVEVLGHYTDGSQLVLSEQLVVEVEETVATFSEGRVQGVGVGQTTLKLSLGDLSVSTDVLVQLPKLTKLTIKPSGLKLRIGEQVGFQVEAEYSDGSISDVTAEVEAIVDLPEIASLDDYNVRGLAAGSANLIVRRSGIEARAVILTGEAAIASISISPEELILVAGASADVMVKGHLGDGREVDLTGLVNYSILNSFRAAMSEDVAGRVIAKNSGATSLSVTYVDPLTGLNFAKLATINVLPPTLDELFFEPDSRSQPLGRNTEFKVKGRFSDGSELDITDQVFVHPEILEPGLSEVAQLELTAAGRIRAVSSAEGTMKIIATKSGLKSSATYTVTAKVLDEVEIIRQGEFSNAGFAEVGDSVSFTAVGVFSDLSTANVTQSGVGIDVTWTAPDAGVATFGDAGGQKLLTGIQEGDASFSISVVYGGDTRTANFNIGVYTSCPEPGKQFNYYCWYLGANNESCDQVCSTHGRTYHAATDTYAGSSGSASNCESLLKSRFSGALKNFSSVATAGAAIGCSIYTANEIDLGIRNGAMATTSSAALGDFRRACACKPSE